jgi:AcrR family transcriptional regulator
MSGETSNDRSGEPSPDRRRRLLDAVLRVLAAEGIAGVSMRAVAREAGVALGLVHYYFDDKTSLIAAALREIEEQDLRIVEPISALSAERRLRAALRRVADPEFLTTEYLALRMQLWALAQVHDEFAEINTSAQARYREGLAGLIHAACPGLSRTQCRRRAADIDVIQNGVWVTALLGLDRASIRRSVAMTEAIALADPNPL